MENAVTLERVSWSVMNDILREGKVDIDALDAGNKNRCNLFDEMRDKDVSLHLVPSPEGIRVVYVSISVRIEVEVPSEGIHYLEFAREYSNGSVEEALKGYALSEKLRWRRAEDPVDCAVRCFQEEAGLDVETSQVKQLLFRKTAAVDEHRSTVYTGLWHYTKPIYVRATFEKAPWPDQVTLIRDRDVVSHVMRFNLSSPKQKAA